MDATLAESIKAQIQIDEGKGPNGLGRMYYDDQHVPTIGYGYNLQEPAHLSRIEDLGYDPEDVLAGRQAITEAHAKQLFEESFAVAVKDANAFLPGLENYPPEVQSVVVNMSFNMGANSLAGFSDFREALQNHDYSTAAKEMVDSKWYGEVGERSERLVEMMENIAPATAGPHGETVPNATPASDTPAPVVESPTSALPPIHDDHEVAEHNPFSLGGGSLFGDGGAIGMAAIAQLVQDTASGIAQDGRGIFAPSAEEVAPGAAGSLFEPVGGATRDLTSVFDQAVGPTAHSSPSIFESTQTTVDNARQSLTDLFTAAPPTPEAGATSSPGGWYSSAADSPPAAQSWDSGGSDHGTSQPGDSGSAGHVAGVSDFS